jgi:NAD(P)H-dependent flavin oxidoreductase YrpB (nitropropane dioxygenase family)
MKTRLTELLGTRYPIIQGGMQNVGYAELAAAVSNAGALGIITGLTQPTPEDLAKEIARCKEMTDQPFGVNLTLLPTIKPVPYEEYAQVIVDAGVKIVETAGRSPEPFMPLFNEHGIKVIHKCTSVRHSLKAQSLGCAAVSVDGFECAGHPGEDDVNKVAERVNEIEREQGKDMKFELISDMVAGAKGKVALTEGDVDYGIWTSGMVQGLIDAIPSCEDLVQEIIRECESTIRDRLSVFAAS